MTSAHQDDVESEWMMRECLEHHCVEAKDQKGQGCFFESPPNFHFMN